MSGSVVARSASQVVGYWGHSGCGANAVGKAARDPIRKSSPDLAAMYHSLAFDNVISCQPPGGRWAP
jgi:hypothetical protein